jgi:hypothetical protein
VSVVGSTGATGLGSLLTEADLPYSADLLRFRHGKLVAIDRLEVVGVSGDLVVQRHTITEADREGDTAGFIFHDVDEARVPEDLGDDTTTTSRGDGSTTTTTSGATGVTTTTVP